MDKVSLLGYRFDNAASVEAVADDLCQTSMPGIRFLITPNAYIIQLFRQKQWEWLFRFSQKASWILADGMPIVWLSRLKHGSKGLKTRLTGSDLFPVLFSKIKENNYPTLFVVPNNVVASKLNEEYKNCNCIVPAFFDPADTDYVINLTGDIIRQAQNSKVTFIFIGLSDPKQTLLCKHIIEQLADSLKDRHCTILLLGASYEFYYGLQQRAPAFWQKSGFEWLYRLCKDPRRLLKRYTVGNFRFLMIAFKELFNKT